ncbi:MAG: ribosome small subunit-dependent GTPase A [Peptococcaceae bacterium]|nr:ribosome small subunit-dependent GTPase A [Peptococcaceae bacterium]
MLKGVLLKGYGGFYYVMAQGEVWECSLRGRFRVKQQDFLPGDRVRILPAQEVAARVTTQATATIEHVYPRTSELTRPPVANVEQVVLVFPLISPDPDYKLLDRILIQAWSSTLEAAVVFTKIDLLRDQRGSGADLSMPEVYRRIGLSVLVLSNMDIDGTSRGEAEDLLRGKISVLAGPSGAGKSSFLNMLDGELKLKTGAVSEKIGRGRHTTRHVELLDVAGGLVADTPGFSALYLPRMEKEELQRGFPEMDPYRRKCRFSSCLHESEPRCAVRTAVEEGMIEGQRYEHYLFFLQELKKQRRY